MKAKTIKKYSFAMASAMFLTNAMPLFTFATIENSIGSINASDDGVSVGVDTTQSQKTEYYDEFTRDTTQNTNVYVSQASNFGVIIPKTIILDGKTKNATYEVSVMGNIGGDENVSVIPEETFLMKQLGKKDIDAIVSQDKTTWAYNEFTTKGNGTIVAENMSAGSWEGQFNFEIKLDATGKTNKIPTTTIVDENGTNLNATIKNIDGTEKEELLNNLVNSGKIANTNEISTLIDVSTDSFENQATATFDMTGIANVGEKVAVYHYNETTSQWEYITTCKVDSENKIIVTFDSFSPVAFQVFNENHTHKYEVTDMTMGNCVTEGTQTSQCTCGSIITESTGLDLIRHSFKIVGTEEVCMECSLCGAKKGHMNQIYHIIQNGTCTTNEIYTVSCYTCKFESEEKIKEPSGHQYENGVCINTYYNSEGEEVQCGAKEK